LRKGANTEGSKRFGKIAYHSYCITNREYRGQLEWVVSAFPFDKRRAGHASVRVKNVKKKRGKKGRTDQGNNTRKGTEGRVGAGNWTKAEGLC